jgi:penicillin-binding protein 1A
MWIYFMSEALRNVPEQQLPTPSGLVTMRINAENGRVASINDTNTVFETFMEGHLPEQGGATSEAAPRAVNSEAETLF